METYIIYILIGVAGGILIGLIGGGIGPITVPTLISIFIIQGIYYDTAVHLAIGTSLSVIIITTLTSIIGHHLNINIYWSILKKLLPGTIIGSMIGSAIAAVLSGKILQLIFGILLIMVATYILKIRDNQIIKLEEVNLPSTINLNLISATLAICSTILGISDGLLLVPYLKKYNIATKDLIKIATVCAFFASITGAIPFYLLGCFDKNLPVGTFSYIYLPAFFVIAFVSCLFTPIGIKLNKKFTEKRLKKVFAVFLAVIGIKMLII